MRGERFAWALSPSRLRFLRGRELPGGFATARHREPHRQGARTGDRHRVPRGRRARLRTHRDGVRAPRLLDSGDADRGAGGNTSASCGAIALAFGIWRIFRPHDRWPIALIASIVVLLWVALRGYACSTSRDHRADVRVLERHDRQRRELRVERLRIAALPRAAADAGADRLGSAEIAQRFLLWGVAGSAAVGIHICSAANRFVDADTIHPALMIVQAAFGLSAAIGIWLAFFPPRRLRRTALSG